MPPLVPQPGVIKITYTFTVGGDANAQVRQFISYTGGPPSGTDLGTIAANVRAPIGILFALQMDADTTFDNIIMQDLSSDTGGEGIGTGTTVGTRTGSSLGADSAVLVNYPITRRYRGGKPRNYWPFFTADDLYSRNAWLSGSVSAMDTVMSELRADLAGATAGTTVLGQLVNVSYYQGFTSVTNIITGRTRDVAKPRTVAIAPDTLGTAVTSSIVASQRRRDQQRR